MLGGAGFLPSAVSSLSLSRWASHILGHPFRDLFFLWARGIRKKWTSSISLKHRTQGESRWLPAIPVGVMWGSQYVAAIVARGQNPITYFLRWENCCDSPKKTTFQNFTLLLFVAVDGKLEYFSEDHYCWWKNSCATEMEKHDVTSG